MKKQIIHIEDSPAVWQGVKEGIDDWFGLENVDIVPLEFEKAADSFIEGNPEVVLDILLVILDLMVEYHTDHSVDIPKEVLREGSFDAGFRLLKKLRNSPSWKGIPVIVYSSVERELVKSRLAELGIFDVDVIEKSKTQSLLLERIGAATRLKRVAR